MCWLRPSYQSSEHQAPGEQTPTQAEADLGEQVAAVRLHLARQPHSAETLARQFKRSPTEKVGAVLDALESLGLVERSKGNYQLLVEALYGILTRR